MPAISTRVLRFHESYRCRNAGACCTSGWPIPIEADRLIALRAALASSKVQPMAGNREDAFVPRADAPSDTPGVLGVIGRRCVFHDPAGSCAIHRSLGHEALPLACRQFPRVSVIDPRGASVTLSHYCPTAASLLNNDDRDDECDAIVIDAPAFPTAGEYVGLDARAALPPLLRPGMLMDWPAWWEVERLGVDVLLHGGRTATEGLAHLRSAVRRLSRWSPADGELDNEVREAFAESAETPPPDGGRLITRALESIPGAFRSDAEWSGSGPPGDRAARRFLAAHAFANWAIHLGGGLSAWIGSIETAHAFLEAGAGVRHTDLVLRHLLDLEKWLGANDYSAPMNGYL